jgi:hypothetical protein
MLYLRGDCTRAAGELGKEFRFLAWSRISAFFLPGAMIGGLGAYYLFVQDIRNIQDQLTTLQQAQPVSPLAGNLTLVSSRVIWLAGWRRESP